MTDTLRLCWFVTYFKQGDAISNQAIAMHREALSLGWESVLFVPPGSDDIEGVATTSMHGYEPAPRDVKVLHYGAYGVMEEWIAHMPPPVFLYYHNVTPTHFFRRVDFPWTEAIEKGRKKLPDLARYGVRGLAVSEYNRRELERAGFRDVTVLPLFIDPEPFQRAANETPSPDFLARYPAAGINWIHVGRLVPNKRVEDIVRAFYLYHTRFNADSHLFLIGSAGDSDVYSQRLIQWLDDVGMSPHVTITGKVSQEELLEFYRLADLYVSMSEHEGFGVPLVEAMWSQIPIIAYWSSAVPDTLGKGGVLVDHKDPVLVAKIADYVLNNHEERAKLLATQLEQGTAWRPHHARAALEKWLATLT